MARGELTPQDIEIRSIISKNINELMKRNKVKQVDIHLHTQIPKSTLTGYVKGTSTPNAGNIQKLANFFDVPKSAIDPRFKKKIDTNKNYITESKRIFIVGNISCGDGVLAYEDIEGFEDTPSSWLNGGNYFYLRAKGDSMNGLRIYDGDLLLIREQQDFENGEIVAVLVNGEALLKRVTLDNDMIILESANPSYPPIVRSAKDNDIRIVGKLKKVVLNF